MPRRSCIEVQQSGGELRLTVLDNGVGFDEASMFREGSHGLMGIRERALMLGGELEIGNSPSGGGRVTVRLPLLADAAARPARHARRANREAPAQRSRRRARTSHERPERGSTGRACCWWTTTPSCARGCGASSRRLADEWQIIEAGSGFQALECLRRQPIGLAIVDLSMPGMSGLELIKRIRAEYPQVMVLVLSMHAEEQYALRSFILRQNPRPPASPRPGLFEETSATMAAGQWQLPGTLTAPKGAGRFPALVLVHGSGPNDRDESLGPNKPFKDLAWGLASRGRKKWNFS